MNNLPTPRAAQDDGIKRRWQKQPGSLTAISGDIPRFFIEHLVLYCVEDCPDLVKTCGVTVNGNGDHPNV